MTSGEGHKEVIESSSAPATTSAGDDTGADSTDWLDFPSVPSGTRGERVEKGEQAPERSLEERMLSLTGSGVGLEAWTALYAPNQRRYPALRFHKDKQWKQQLQAEGKFHGDAYALREGDYGPSNLNRSDNRDKFSAGKHNPNPEKYVPEDAFTLAGYNAGLRATVERAVHRNLTEHGTWNLETCQTIGDVIVKIREAGPLLVVDVEKPAGYERYFSPDYSHDSFGKVGKRDFLEHQILAEFEVVPAELDAELANLQAVSVQNVQAYNNFRTLVIEDLIARIIGYLNLTYGN